MCFLCKGRSMIQLVRSMHIKAGFVAFSLLFLSFFIFFFRFLLWFRLNIITVDSFGAQNFCESTHIASFCYRVMIHLFR